MNRNDKLLTIIEKLIDLTKEGHTVEYILGLPWEDYWCWDPWDKWPTEDEIEDEWEEVTEHVKDYSPNTLKEENEHLKNLIDLICETFWFEKYVTEKWSLWIAWDKWLLEEIAKARKIINK